MLTFEQIKELVNLVMEHGLRCIELERSGFRLKIEGPRGSSDTVSAPPVAPPPSPPQQPPPAPPGESGVEPAEEEAAASPAPAGAHVLRSPIVGTFYAAPSPEAEPFTHVGDRVQKGQVLCIVEAMKLMNEIESDVDGVILEVYPKNAQPVEFEEALFAIRPE